MLNDDVLELYYLLSKEKKIKEEMSIIKESLDELKNNIEILKENIKIGMININHKYVNYKNMDIILKTKPEKIKLDRDSIYSIIEKIIEDESIETKNKREKILSVLKPVDSGKNIQILGVKLKKI